MRLITYIRVSRVAGREGDSFISPDVQREAIARYVKGAGHKIVGEELDLDQSGGKIDRPGFERALAAVEAGEADGIAVAKLDRFARSVAGAAKALERLEAAGGSLVSVDLGIDTSTAAGRLMRNVLTALAEFELDRIRDNWAEVRDRAIARGIHICKVPPVGYRRGDDGRLEPDPVAAPIVREVFIRRAGGASWNELGVFLDEKLPRENGGAWSRQTVGGVVARRTYLGEARQGDVVNADAHSPIVTRGEWEAAQHGAAGPAWEKRGGGAPLLAGLLRCASCGFVLTYMTDGRRGYHNYRCRVRHGAGVCESPARVSSKRIEPFIGEAVREWLAAEGIAAEAVEAADGIAEAVARVEAAEAELVAYRDTGLVSVIGRAAFLEGLTVRQYALEDARRELEEGRSRGRSELPAEPLVLAELWPSLEVDERRAIIAAAIDTIAVAQAGEPGQGTKVADRIRIFWHGEGPDDLPGRGSSALRPIPLNGAPDEVRLAAA
jgi:DNA invertase Pin-like site-specific DNA recombinase